MIADAQEKNLSLEELALEVARRLDALGLSDAPGDGRVSAVPDPRTIRYYTTLGLLDRPGIAGRQARYGARHALQLLAVKALQRASLPLAEIQARLYGRTDAELEAIVAAAAEAGARQERGAGAKPIGWREVTVEPGLRIVAQEGWRSGADPSALIEKIRAALAALTGSGADGLNEEGAKR